MRHVVVGTAGHVDHGKTALVFALTGVQTDRLPEEQRRGITIELGFAPWRIADEILVSIIDVPGHRSLVHTMIAGAAGIDIVLLVVAGDEGVMPQTREHVAACKLLGVRRAVVAVTKLDRIDAELAELAAEEARELCAAHGIAATTVCCSARSGQGLDAVRAAVLEAIGASEPRPVGGHARLWVDRVFSVHGSGTVVTGTLVAGALALGSALRIVGPERELGGAVRGLHVHGEACERVAAPTRLAINLASGAGHGRVGVGDVVRGDLVTTDPDVGPTRLLDVWLEAEAPIRRGSQASFFVGTSRGTVRIQPIAAPSSAEADAASEPASPSAAPARPPLAALGSQSHGFARLRLSSPLVVAGGDRFVLRGAQIDGPAGAVIGGGVVLDARPPGRWRAGKRAGLLQAARRGDARALVGELVAESSPRPLLRSSLGARLSLPSDALGRAAEALVAAGELVSVQAVGWLSEPGLGALRARAAQLVGAHHRVAPLEPGLPLQTLREQIAAIAGAEATAELLGRLAAEAKRAGASPPTGSARAPGGGTRAKGSAGPKSAARASAAKTEPAVTLLVEGDVVRLASFGGVSEDAAASRAFAAAAKLLGSAGLSGVTDNALAQAVCDGDLKQSRALLAMLGRKGAALRAGDLWFDAASVAELRARLGEHLAHNGKLTIQQFKAMTGLGRRQTIPLLEHFDREGLTRRQGDDRVPGR